MIHENRYDDEATLESDLRAAKPFVARMHYGYHLNDDQLMNYRNGRLTETDAVSTRAHMVFCDECFLVAHPVR